MGLLLLMKSVKHDEEYMPPELAEQLKGIKHVKPQQATSSTISVNLE